MIILFKKISIGYFRIFHIYIYIFIKEFSKYYSFKLLNNLFWNFPYKQNVAVPDYSHRQLRGFRREEHTAAHVLCLFEPVGRVAQNMSKKACETNRKRSMSVGIAGEAVSCTSKNTKNQLQSTNKICYYLSYEHKCISDANTGGQIRQWKRKPHILF